MPDHDPDPNLNSDPDPEEGGTTRVPLSEAITAVLDELGDCASVLSVIRHQLREQELPEGVEAEEEDLPLPEEHARHIAARPESCAGAIRNASGESMGRPGT